MNRLLLLATVACATALYGQSRDEQILARFYPVELRDDEAAGEMQTAYVELPSASSNRLLATAYCNREEASVAVISTTGEGALVAQEVPASMFGRHVALELLDVTGDQKPEIVVTVEQVRGLPTTWIYSWTGSKLVLLGPKVTPASPLDSASDLTDAAFFDIDGDGIAEILDHKYFRVTDSNGNRLSGAEYSICHASDETRSAGTALDFYSEYRRAEGAPGEIVDEFEVEDTTVARELLVVNGSNGHGVDVSSAVVSVNGVTVLKPSDLNQKIGRLRLPVGVVAGKNTISVRVDGAPDAKLFILIRSVME